MSRRYRPQPRQALHPGPDEVTFLGSTGLTHGIAPERPAPVIPKVQNAGVGRLLDFPPPGGAQLTDSVPALGTGRDDRLASKCRLAGLVHQVQQSVDRAADDRGHPFRARHVLEPALGDLAAPDQAVTNALRQQVALIGFQPLVAPAFDILPRRRSYGLICSPADSWRRGDSRAALGVSRHAWLFVGRSAGVRDQRGLPRRVADPPTWWERAGPCCGPRRRSRDRRRWRRSTGRVR